MPLSQAQKELVARRELTLDAQPAVMAEVQRLLAELRAKRAAQKAEKGKK